MDASTDQEWAVLGPSSLQASLIGPNDPRWADMLASTPHDFYHLPAYVSLAAVHEGGQPRALLVSENSAVMLLPIIIRPLAEGGRDATSPYGYPGPLYSISDTRFARAAWSTGLDLLRSTGLVSLFVRFHPLLVTEPPAGIGTVIRHGDTVAIDLALPKDVLWRQTRKSHRRDIEKAMAAGYESRLDSTWQHFETFKRLYRGTMRRSAAGAYYFFDDAYFEALREALGQRLILAVCEVNGVVAAAGLYTESCGIIQAHLSGVDPDFARDAPTKLLDHHVVGWAKERGNRWLHLGGGRRGDDDSLLQYKAGFSPLRFPYHSLRVALDEGEYARRTMASDPSVDPSQLDGYFPAYRRG